jgi:hypothetical protein
VGDEDAALDGGEPRDRRVCGEGEQRNEREGKEVSHESPLMSLRACPAIGFSSLS